MSLTISVVPVTHLRSGLVGDRGRNCGRLQSPRLAPKSRDGRAHRPGQRRPIEPRALFKNETLQGP